MAEERILLVGLKEIAQSVGAGQKTVKKWIRTKGFPARRCEDGPYRASRGEVERWWREQGKGK